MSKLLRNNILESETQDEELTLREKIALFNDWIKYIFSNWLIILLIGISGGLLGIGYAFLQKPLYKASTTFVLEGGGGSGGELGQYAGLASMIGINIGGGGSAGLFSGDNILALYKSRYMAEKTLMSVGDFKGKKQRIIDRYIEIKEFRKKWDSDPKLKNLAFDDSEKFTFKHDSILREVIFNLTETNLKVERPDKKTSIIRVEFLSEDELFAKNYVDQLVSNVNSFYIHTKTQKMKENVDILQKQTDSVTAVMNGAIFLAASTLDATPNLSSAKQRLRAPAQRFQFSAEANKVLLGELIKNLELSKLTLRKETPLIQVLDVPKLPLEIEPRVGKAKGLIIGGILAGIVAILWLVLRRQYKNLIFNE